LNPGVHRVLEAWRRQEWRQSAFWRVAGLLLGVQLFAVAVAFTMSATAAYDRALDLAAEGLRLRLDALAEDVEVRADWGNDGLRDLSVPLLRDLSARFPDPVVVVDASGQAIFVARPGGQIDTVTSRLRLPADLVASLTSGLIQTSRQEGWMAAPIYDDVGFLSGGVVVQPINNSLQRELQPARSALFRALGASAIVVLVLALLLAASVTLRLVGPLRQMTRRVEAIGNGDYDQRLEVASTDEMGRLAETINNMAEQVARSIQELRATDRMRRELVANVGHDLRTPLTALVGRVDEANRVLDEGRKLDAGEHLRKASRQAAYLKRLVDDLFELSILDSPSPTLRREPIPIAELIDDAAEQYRTLLAKRGIGLEVSVDEDMPLLEADGVRLLRLINNLLSNAEHHTPDDGMVKVVAGRSAHSPELLEISVTDSGDGLEGEDPEELFERYYRGTDARTRSSEGTGLGLAISRAAAVAHGGDLSAANAPDGGAVFTLTLPMDEWS
jgi:signal transduction histidine kinase